jgi:hypothetical protein
LLLLGLLLLWLLLSGKGIAELGRIEEGVDPVDERLEERTCKKRRRKSCLVCSVFVTNYFGYCLLV